MLYACLIATNHDESWPPPRSRLATLAACIALAILSFFQFPGHTWLQQDSQIYVAILEHQWDPSALRNDILVDQPNIAFTLYDEAARALRVITRLDFHAVLVIQQILTRALGIWGLYLMAAAIGSPAPLLVAAICTLGATIAGPAVLTFEYEPTPRAFAIPLVICAIGLASRERYLAAAFAGGAAFLYHPPSALPFLALFLLVILAPRNFTRAPSPPKTALLPLIVAAIAIALDARGSGESFFGRIPPFQEQLQRFRASYNWISTWPAAVIWNHVILFVIVLAAFARLRRRIPSSMGVFVLGLPVLGILSMPLSWLLLDHFHWSLIPQWQPMRTLLFVALMAQFLAAAAGVFAAIRKQWIESAVWFALAYILPLHPVLPQPVDLRAIVALVLLAAIAVASTRRIPLLAAAAAFFIIPILGGVTNYPHLHTTELAGLSAWADASTPRDAVFLFPDAGRALDPGIFRCEAVRALYVDWKGGGQVNYSASFAETWGRRWNLVGAAPIGLGQYVPLGISYVVLNAAHRLNSRPVFENARYVVYQLPAR